MKRFLSLFIAIAVLAFVASPAFAANTTNLIYTPTTAGLVNVAGISSDSSPDYSSGSFTPANTTGPKSEIYISPSVLFGRDVLLSEIKNMSYWTKTGFLHSVDPRDWYLNIYTKPYAGQLGGSWYGTRIGAEPYFSENINDPANTWNKWTTDTTNNQLRFFESTYGYYGSYTDSHWSSFVAGNSLPGVRGPGVAYGSQPILYFYLGTGSAWANGFTGQLDGLRVELNDGSIATVNFELLIPDTTAPTVPTNGLPNASFLNTNVFDFTWDVSTDDVGPITYEFQSSLNSTEVDGVLTTGLWKSGTLSTPMIHSTGAPDGRWYWQVRAKDGADNYSDWSQIWSVTLDTIAPAIPTLVSPLNNSTVNVHDFMFDWNDVSDATAVTYDWQSSYSDTFASVLAAHTGLTSSTVNSPGTPDGVYYWRVLARDAAGNVSKWSTVWKVTVDTSAPVVLVPTDKNQCKDNGWKTFTNPEFKNQGQCVSYVVSNENAGKRN